MNTKTLVAAATLALIGSLANAADEPLTRAQVNAEVAAARANGTLRTSDFDYGASTADQRRSSTTTRAQVKAAFAKAAADGTLQRTDFDVTTRQAAAPTTFSRAEVNAEVREAIANGTLPRTDFEYDHGANFAHGVAPKDNAVQRFFARHGFGDKTQSGS